MQVSPSDARRRRELLDIYRVVLDSVAGRRRVAEALSRRETSAPVYVAAVGKAAPHMAAGAWDVLGGDVAAGLVITKRGHLGAVVPETAPFRLLEAAHPVPDESSLEAGRALVSFIAGIPPPAQCLFLLSGGASSLVEVLPEGVGAETLARINQWLLASGLPIGAMNRVRKHVSHLKGGRLVAHLSARRTLALLLSDVPGDDPKVIGSGPLAAHRPEDIALDDLELPQWLAELARDAPPLPEARAFRAVHTEIVAGPTDARRAAVQAGRSRGFAVREHAELMAGEAQSFGHGVARALLEDEPALHVWVGETTVHLPPDPGRGGRCQSLALAAAVALRERPHAFVLAAGTDGTDGPGEDAGALVDGGTLARGGRAGLDAGRCLERADAGTFLEASGDLIHTGPTGTNVMDLVLGVRAAPEL